MFDYLIKGATIVDGTGQEPYSGDVGIKDNLIAAIGQVDGEAKETIDAQGAYVTPGWVDIHTHFDGQVSWDDTLDPSFSAGVTSIVMGNCGVGFAPCAPGSEMQLVELMEGVEDIPGTALYEGIPWGKWESFPEFIDYLGSREYTMDVGAQIPHSALRFYVMGERALNHENATAEDIEKMCALVKEGVEAGALGFSTSRTVGHQSISGDAIPGTFAEKDELLQIVKAMGDKGVFQAVPEGLGGDFVPGQQWTMQDDVNLYGQISQETGRPCTFTMVQNETKPMLWHECLKIAEKYNEEGAHLVPQTATRSIGFVSSIQTYNIFMRRPTYMKLKESLPHEDLITELQKPEVKAQILSEEDVPPEVQDFEANVHQAMVQMPGDMFKITLPIDYEPDQSEKFSALAESAGMSLEEYMYDYLVEGDGNNFTIRMMTNFVNGIYKAIEDMLQHPATTIGLSDAGAHCNMIFDALNPTYQIMHWVRDRNKGPRLPIELMVHKQTGKNAALFGLDDRGVIEVGRRADLNIFKLEDLALGDLKVAHDLPAGGNRILQSASGYLATMVNGVITRRNDQDTGARPGRVIRG